MPPANNQNIDLAPIKTSPMLESIIRILQQQCALELVEDKTL